MKEGFILDIKDNEWKLESEWLEKVLNEVETQLDEKSEFGEKFRKENIKTQRELWSEVGSISSANDLDQLVDFLSFVDVMKTQKRSYDFNKKLQERYEKMIISPYFGRIDFHENGEEEEEKHYIGISNLINDNYDIFVYDWRAPVSSMFYDYEIGDAGYNCPEGEIKGYLSLKRQYKINNGKIDYMFDSNLKIDDEILQGMLARSTDGRMKDIVTTIQREQNKVIRNEEYKNLIVQGPAGSGKTSVALHRIAYILYKHREKITCENIIIFSPNQIFNDYISNVLPQLGEDNVFQVTFQEYMHRALGRGYVKEKYCDMMEYILNSKGERGYENRIRSIRYKSSPEFMEALKRYTAYVEENNRVFTDIFYRDNLVISLKDLKELFYKDYKNFPLKKRLAKIRERILFLLKPHEEERKEEVIIELRSTGFYIDEHEISEKSREIIRNELEYVYSQINNITKFSLVGLYRNLFKNLERFYGDTNSNENKEEVNKMKRYTLEALNSGRLYYEDQIPLLYLKGVLGDFEKTSQIKYVIIDEAQDYTQIQYEIFHKLFGHASITMLGDINQSINPFMNVGNYNRISSIFPEDDTEIINLTKSYRSTAEITKFSRKLLNKEVTAECVERSGDEPIVLGFSKKSDINQRVLNDVKSYKDKGYKSIGIITRTSKEVIELKEFLEDKIEVKSITKDDDEYTNGILIIPAYLAKGLEFDVVLIYNAGDGNYYSEDERLLLYTACTRALHVLCVYYLGKCTPLIKSYDNILI